MSIETAPLFELPQSDADPSGDAGTAGVPASPEGRLRAELEAVWAGASERQVALAVLAAGEYAAAMVEQHARRPGRTQG